MPAGRPTKYNAMMVALAEHYVDHFRDYDDEIPSNVGLAPVLDVCVDTLYDWANDPEKPEFSDILVKIKAKQRQVLINQGLNGTFNSAIAKLVLGKHGFHEKQDRSVTGKDGGPIQSVAITAAVDSKEAGRLYKEFIGEGG